MGIDWYSRLLLYQSEKALFSTCCLFLKILCTFTCAAGMQAFTCLCTVASCSDGMCHIGMSRCNVTTLMALADGSPGRMSVQRHESLMLVGPEIGKSWREKRNRGGEQLRSERGGQNRCGRGVGGRNQKWWGGGIGSDWKWRRKTDEVRLLLARERRPRLSNVGPGRRDSGGRAAALFTTTALPKWTRKKLQRARSKILL